MPSLIPPTGTTALLEVKAERRAVLFSGSTIRRFSETDRRTLTLPESMTQRYTQTKHYTSADGWTLTLLLRERRRRMCSGASPDNRPLESLRPSPLELRGGGVALGYGLICEVSTHFMWTLAETPVWQL